MAKQIINGKQIYDTGWITPSYNSGYANSTLQYRRVGDIVYIRGQASPIPAGVVFNLPVDMRPSLNFIMTCPGSSLNYGKFEIRTDGAVNVAVPPSGGSYMGLTVAFPIG